MAQRKWSYTMGNLLEVCERRLFFTYFAGARRNSRDPRLKELGLLHPLKTITAWIGEIVHEEVAHCLRRLKAGQPMDWEVIADRAVKIAERQWAFSEKRLYREISPSKAGEGFAAIFEHECDIELPAGMLDQAISTIVRCLSNFNDLKDRLGIPDALSWAIRSWIEPPVFGRGATNFNYGDVTVTVKVDMAIQNRDGQFVIYDWKTGKTDATAYVAQMECYLLWPHLALGVDLDKLTAFTVNLETSQVESFYLDHEKKWSRLAAIQKSAEDIDSLMIEPEQAVVDMEDFSYARHVKLCERCPIQRVCQEW